MENGTRKRGYQSPRLDFLGAVERVTMGHGGSTWDGHCSYTQRGKGNDLHGPSVGHGGPRAHSSGNGGGQDNGCP